MKMRDFIRENREEIDACIDRAVGHVPKEATCYCPKSGTDHFHQPERRNDKERQDWVMSDEGLYRWARRSGVPV